MIFPILQKLILQSLKHLTKRQTALKLTSSENQ